MGLVNKTFPIRLCSNSFAIYSCISGSRVFEFNDRLWSSFSYLVAFPAVENLPFCATFHCSSSSRKDYPEFSSSGSCWTLFSHEKNNPALRRELRATEVFAGGYREAVISSTRTTSLAPMPFSVQLSGEGHFTTQTDCWESFGGSNVDSGVYAKSWESTFLKWNIVKIGSAMWQMEKDDDSQRILIASGLDLVITES